MPSADLDLQPPHARSRLDPGAGLNGDADAAAVSLYDASAIGRIAVGTPCST